MAEVDFEFQDVILVFARFLRLLFPFLAEAFIPTAAIITN